MQSRWRAPIQFLALPPTTAGDDGPGEIDPAPGAVPGQDPNYQLPSRARMRLPRAVLPDAGLRAAEAFDGPQLDGHVGADADAGTRLRL